MTKTPFLLLQGAWQEIPGSHWLQDSLTNTDIMLLKCGASLLSFGRGYISVWKINKGDFSIHSILLPVLFCVSVFYFFHISVLLLNNSNPHTSTLECAYPTEIGPQQMLFQCVPYETLCKKVFQYCISTQLGTTMETVHEIFNTSSAKMDHCWNP